MTINGTYVGSNDYSENKKTFRRHVRLYLSSYVHEISKLHPISICTVFHLCTVTAPHLQGRKCRQYLKNIPKNIG